MTPPASPASIGNHRELFIDDALIAKLSGGAEQRMHQPQPREIAIKHDEVWEGTGCGYHTIFQDGDLYRMYYKGFDISVETGKVVCEDIEHRFTCYAESDDGINWRKPELGLVEFEGSKANNISVGSGPNGPLNVDAAHTAIFKDTNPAATKDALYKGIFRSNEPRGLNAMKSPDGINWTPMADAPVITDGAFDSQNLAFWDDHRGEYRAYWRAFEKPAVPVPHSHPDGVRSIRTATSPDMINWSKAEDLTYDDGDTRPMELYVNQIKNYHRAPHLMIGFPAHYFERPWGSSLRALPDREHRELRSTAQDRYGTAISNSLLICSRNAVDFKRWPEAFLAPGPERTGTWNYGHQYMAWHIVETASSFAPDGPNELSLYGVENYWLGKGSNLRRYTLRLDGFVSIKAPWNGGECLTQPITFEGEELRLNFATSAAGEIRVELQSEDGAPLPGFALDDCDPIFGDAVDRAVVWKDNPNLAQHAGKTVRLRFSLRDADLYAYRFYDPSKPDG